MLESVIEPAQRHLAKRFVSTYFQQLGAEHGNCEFSIRLADGTTLASTQRPPFTLVISHAGVLQEILDSPDELTLGKLFVGGDLDVEGDMEAALQFAELLMSHPPKFTPTTNLRLLAAALPK